MQIESLKGFKIESVLDQRLCEYLGRYNLVGVSERELRKNGLLIGNELVQPQPDTTEKVEGIQTQQEKVDAQAESHNIDESIFFQHSTDRGFVKNLIAVEKSANLSDPHISDE